MLAQPRRCLGESSLSQNIIEERLTQRAVEGGLVLDREHVLSPRINLHCWHWGCGRSLLRRLRDGPDRCGVSDVIRRQGREAVERDRCVGGGISARTLDQNLVADLEADGLVGLLLIKHVRRITGRAGKHAGRERASIVWRADGITDRLVHGLGEAAELADVEIDPAHVITLALLRNEHDLGLDHAGIADEPASRLDDGLRDTIAEMLAQRAKDRAAIGLHRRYLLEVPGGKAAAEIDHGKIYPALRAGTKNRRCRFEGIVPGLDATLLRTHMERDAAGIEPALTSVV